MKCEINVPDGESGEWAISSFEISEDEASFYNMRQLFSGARTGVNRAIKAGGYKRLTCHKGVVMSNTPAEISEHMPFFHAAIKANQTESGLRFLINGLGLGMLIQMLMNDSIWENIEKIIVVEKSKDVIALAAPTYESEKVEIIHADALEYKPEKGSRFSAVWHDIWTEICTDNYDDMKALHRKYGRLTDWQGSWSREYVERMIREERREQAYYL